MAKKQQVAGSNPALPSNSILKIKQMIRTATPRLKKTTDCQDARAARDLAVYNEFKTCAAIEGQSKTQIVKYLMKKYGFHSNATVYAIIQRVQERLSQEGGMK